MTPGLLGGSKGIRTPDPLTPCKNKRDRSGGGVGKILYKYGEESTNHPQHKGPKFALCGVLWSPWRDHVVTFALIRSNTPSALQNRRYAAPQTSNPCVHCQNFWDAARRWLDRRKIAKPRLTANFPRKQKTGSDSPLVTVLLVDFGVCIALVVFLAHRLGFGLVSSALVC
jgi:hypothetical protein